MARGRKPVPAEKRRKNGNPSKRPIGDPVLVGARIVADEPIEVEVDEIDPMDETETDAAAVAVGDAVWMPAVPETLRMVDELDDDEAATKLWNQICALLVESNIITEGDLYAVEAYVMAVLEARRAYFELRTEGSTVETVNPNGGRASKTTHPAYRVWRDANAMMLKWGEQLGLSPVARGRIGLQIGKGRKLAQELEAGLTANPLERKGEVE